MLVTPVPTRQFTLEEYMIVQDRVEVKLELVRGEIHPKEGRSPLPVEVVEKILSPDFPPLLVFKQSDTNKPLA